MKPADVLRNRLGASGVNITLDTAMNVIELLSAQGWKLTSRTSGEHVADLVSTDKGIKPGKMWSIMHDAL